MFLAFTWIHFDICLALLINQVKWLPLKLAYACCSYSLHYYYYSTFENSSNSPPSEKKRKSCLSNVLRDHPYITSAKGLGWWVKKMSVFADAHYCIQLTQWVGGLEQVQKCADVIYGFCNANIQPALLSSQLLKWRARAEHTSLTL